MPITRYEDDLYRWAEETAQAIAEGRFDEIDRAQVADEVDDLGKSEVNSLSSHLERIELHLLKLRYQEDKRTRSWELSVAESRARIRRVVRRSPSLRRLIPELVIEVYEAARLAAERETGLLPDVFPEECPFTVEEVVGSLE